MGHGRAAARPRAAQRAQGGARLLGALCTRGRAHERVGAPRAARAAACRDRRQLRPRPRDARPLLDGGGPPAAPGGLVPRLARRRQGARRALSARGRARVHAGALRARAARLRRLVQRARAGDPGARRR